MNLIRNVFKTQSENLNYENHSENYFVKSLNVFQIILEVFVFQGIKLILGIIDESFGVNSNKLN